MIKIIIIIAVLFFIITVLWRFSSRRHQLPCPSCLGWLVELDNPFAKAHQAKTIIQNLHLEKGMSVLDVGCGPGRLTIPLATEIAPSGRVLAMDLQKEMLNKTKEKADALKLKNIDYLLAGIGNNRLESDQFDRILMVAVLGEIPDQESALKEVFRALKPGGILSITETIFDPHYQRRSKVLQLAYSLGFRENESFGGIFAYTINFSKNCLL